MPLRKILVSLCLLLPTSTVFAAVQSTNEPPGRLVESSWEEVLHKLANNRMPAFYYEFLASHGITSIDELVFADQQLKNQLIEMYKEDKAIMAGSDATRSVW